MTLVACDGRRDATYGSRAQRRPNLVLLVIDALRADRLGAYGYERPVSPRLDAFAADAVLFEHATAQASWTRPAMISIFTGLLPQQHGTNGTLDRLADGHTTLAELLAAPGYENAAFVSNANMSRRFGVAQGFSTYRQMRRWESRGEPLVKAAIEWLDLRADPSQPFFLYLHVVEPHAPYRPPPDLVERFAPGPAPVADAPDRGFMKRLGTGEVSASPEIVDWMRDLYDGEVASADYAFASLVGELRVRGLYDSSIVVVTADHGEELYEHGGWEHGKTLYAEVLDVPLMVRLPGGARGRRVAAPVQQIDLMPTLLEAAGVEGPKGLRGRSLVPLLATGGGGERGEDEAALSSDAEVVSLLDLDDERQESVTADGWRLIRRQTANGNVEELYRLTEDPGEKRNLAASEPVTVARLGALLDEAGRGASAQPPEAAVVDRKLERELRALGYL